MKRSLIRVARLSVFWGWHSVHLFSNNMLELLVLESHPSIEFTKIATHGPQESCTPLFSQSPYLDGYGWSSKMWSLYGLGENTQK